MFYPRIEKKPRVEGGEEKNCHVSTASLLCCLPLQLRQHSFAAVLSAAAAVATCVCRTQLCYYLYVVPKYSSCLVSYVYGCLASWAWPSYPDVVFSGGFDPYSTV